jgi:hypothetical protein
MISEQTEYGFVTSQGRIVRAKPGTFVRLRDGERIEAVQRLAGDRMTPEDREWIAGMIDASL